MKIKNVLRVTLLILIALNTHAQSIEGFWKVDLVMVGDMDVTPVAKWFKYHEDNTYQAGNGWSQNDIGTYTYDTEKAEFLPLSKQNGPDEFGSFTTTFKNGNMYWEREEEGMKVKVTLSPTAVMPMAPKDSIVGNWKLIAVHQGNEDINETDTNEMHEEIFISWTGNYRITKPNNEQIRGIWHMNAHRSQFHMIDWNQEADFMAFDVSFENDLLKMIPHSDKTIIYTYQKQ